MVCQTISVILQSNLLSHQFPTLDLGMNLEEWKLTQGSQKKKIPKQLRVTEDNKKNNKLKNCSAVLKAVENILSILCSHMWEIQRGKQTYPWQDFWAVSILMWIGSLGGKIQCQHAPNLFQYKTFFWFWNNV